MSAWTSHRPHHRPAGGPRRRSSSPCARRGARSCRTPSVPSTTGWSPTPTAAPTPRRSCVNARSGTPSSSSSRCRRKSTAKYSAAWEEVQIQFVDNPGEAVATADDLVTQLITERGYPTGDYDDQLANLSVEHAAHARATTATRTRSASAARTARPAPRTCARRWSTTGRSSPTCSARTRSSSSGTATTSRPSAVPAQTDAKTVNDTDVAGTRPDATSAEEPRPCVSSPTTRMPATISRASTCRNVPRR